MLAIRLYEIDIKKRKEGTSIKEIIFGKTIKKKR